ESRGGEHTRTPRRVVAQRGEAAAPLLVGGDRPRAQGRITMTALPLLPSTVAVMVTVPVRFVFTRPFLSTSAVRLSLDFHITFLLRSVPSAARTSAVSWTSVPLRASVNAGVTMTVAAGGGGGGSFTVTAAVPDTPSDVAVTVTLPFFSAIALPCASMLSTAASLDFHTTVLPVSVVPSEAFKVAVNCWTPPVTSVTLAGETVTFATGWVVLFTVTAADPLFPSDVAVIVAVPSATAITFPVPSTVATAALLVVHETVRPVSTVPSDARVSAVSVPVSPGFRSSVAGCTTTVATGTGDGVCTVTVAVPVTPSAVARTVAVPTLTAVSRPVRSMLATPGASVAQMTGRSGSAVPSAAVTVAWNWSVAPTSSVADGGETLTAATGRTVTCTSAA